LRGCRDPVNQAGSGGFTVCVLAFFGGGSCEGRVSVWRGDQPTDFGELSVVLSVPSYGSRRVVYEPAS
jgi:hypothetical protein